MKQKEIYTFVCGLGKGEVYVARSWPLIKRIEKGRHRGEFET